MIQKRFAIDVTKTLEKNELHEFEKDSTRFLDLRSLVVEYNLDWGEAALLSQSRSILHWNMLNKFCSACGHPTVSKEAGYKRTCSNVNCITQKGVHNIHHPRSDPVAIMCILSPDGKKILLGKKRIGKK